MLKVGQLIIVAGPSCAGKTYLINKMARGGCPLLCQALGVDDINQWRSGSFRFARLTDEKYIDKFILHLDLHSHFSVAKDNQILFDFIHSADAVTVLTLCSLPGVIKRRNALRWISFSMSVFSKPKDYRRMLGRMYVLVKRQKNNNDISFFMNIYGQWNSFIDAGSFPAYWLDSADLSNEPYYLFNKFPLRISGGKISFAGLPPEAATSGCISNKKRLPGIGKTDSGE